MGRLSFFHLLIKGGNQWIKHLQKVRDRLYLLFDPLGLLLPVEKTSGITKPVEGEGSVWHCYPSPPIQRALRAGIKGSHQMKPALDRSWECPALLPHPHLIFPPGTLVTLKCFHGQNWNICLLILLLLHPHPATPRERPSKAVGETSESSRGGGEGSIEAVRDAEICPNVLAFLEVL